MPAEEAIVKFVVIFGSLSRAYDCDCITVVTTTGELLLKHPLTLQRCNGNCNVAAAAEQPTSHVYNLMMIMTALHTKLLL